MGKVYDILLDEVKIGTSRLENADAPMGVVFGRIDFIYPKLGYQFFKNYCLQNKVDFTDYPEDKLISTRMIPDLNVYDKSGYEIKGLASSISGMDSDQFDISIEGISYPFYQEEFPHHVKAYQEMLKQMK
ncbi:hypothetical protein [Mucilaginibacter lappiensis]|uniref:Uncharacterized protein n=1 Tax=Mucilaginibacter lappiensis TaxID=354630 RepID=A0A841JD17_9SPHI|nr:hypothetical protein [Mucilaginibacter lappiensis]MBB6127486.1 hypothetical protein [Mucilaginibacter lappiensis]